MSQIEDLKHELQGLRVEVNAGKLYKSLGLKLSDLLDTVPVTPKTDVSLPDDGAGIKGLILHLNEEIREGTLTRIEDGDLLNLLNHLKSPDPAIRDKGVYFLFNDLMQQKVLTQDQLRLAVRYLSSDQVLFSHITEPENEAVYQRSFAVLILSLVLYADRVSYHVLTADEISAVVDQIACYIILEKDTRGFIGSNGWAHVYTHIGNLLDELADRDSLTRADKLFLMATLIERYKQLDGALIFGEPQRIAGYLAHLTSKNRLYADYLLSQLKRWRQQLIIIQTSENEAVWNRIYNRGRLIEAMIIRHDFNEAIMQYLSSVIDFFGIG
ncbi:DUF2785 domain-containing protein [Secundilactobacillus kimchicus]|uniref:DUF2785 domain-containing protein n=1 Tax=Secundilactobacillus kimchicus TaxID=528209 RepID=UPI0006E206FD|nr:DUF2785 domain-containing protein [Secundilactobacillus kimchicus]